MQASAFVSLDLRQTADVMAFQTNIMRREIGCGIVTCKAYRQPLSDNSIPNAVSYVVSLGGSPHQKNMHRKMTRIKT
jgi:hypothetical protein